MLVPLAGFEAGRYIAVLATAAAARPSRAEETSLLPQRPAFPPLSSAERWFVDEQFPSRVPAQFPPQFPPQFPSGAAPSLFAPELAQAGGGASPLSWAPPPRRRRWSADGWALLRDGRGGSLSPGALPANYGASQAGAVLRYRLHMSSRLRPDAYMRTTSSLGQYRETAAALGLSARPFPGVPLVAAVEGRLTEQAGGRRVQPAAFAYSELPAFALPGRMRAETYLQGGYVGGRFATLFGDGQVRIDRGLWRSGPVEARLGGGIWGGAQRDAARLDAGPSATVALPLGRGAFGRVAVDWRFRVAGDAQPGSGPAVTLSAGF